MNWANVRAQVGLDGDGGFFLHFTDDQGQHAYLTVDRQCHVLVIAPGQKTQYGDDVTPDEAFFLLTGKKAADVREVLGQ
jgi:hypothetical protein